jgi:hypothetical protein
MIKAYNVINNRSADEQVAQSVAAVTGMLRVLGIDYAVFGSCGIQTYFKHFFRLPNDIDIIVRNDAVSALRAYCAEEGHEFIEEFGRSKMYFGGFPVHIIPGLFSSINKATNMIFAQIDLGGSISDTVGRRMRLPCATSEPEIKVAPLELCLFMDLLRTVNTKSLMTVFFVFRHLDIDDRKFWAIVYDNCAFAETIRRRLEEYPAKLNEVGHFSDEGVLFAQTKMSKLRRFIEVAGTRVIE